MNIHHWVFKMILGKNQSVRTDGRMDNVKTVYPTTNKVCGGGYNNTLKECDSIYAASIDLQINSGIIIYSCKNMHKPEKRYTFCYKKFT